MKAVIFSILLFVSVHQNFYAQTPWPTPSNIAKCYEEGTRSTNGTPGQNYWQNHADYNIQISFNPHTREIAGKVRINYRNNSPDTLRKILYKLYSNLYQRQAMRSVTIAPEDLGDGITIQSLRLNERAIDPKDIKIKGTVMSVTGADILPHTNAQAEITYHYTLNKGSFIRTGQVDTGSFFIAYFFPRIAVYDDVDGWDVYPYTGQYEFYNDYGNFHLEIKVPSQYMVWATGELQNAEQIYSNTFLKRIQEASLSDTVMDIITANDLQTAHITQGDSDHCWIFNAQNVTDVAFAVSNNNIWQAGSVMVDSMTRRRTRIDAVYNPADTSCNHVADYALRTVRLMSHHFPAVPFPYSHMTIVEGRDAMEYPMMVNQLPFESRADAIEFTAHEVFHSLFPFMVGTNETKYSFMDEGWATMTEFTFHPLIDSATPVTNNTSDVNRSAGSEQDVPVMTLTPQLSGAARYADKDMKPALAFLYLRELLGEKRLAAALRSFINAWAGKHPTPYDLFNCINAGTGTNLNWFWDNWFFHKYIPDLAISKVKTGQSKTIINIARKGEAMVPVHLTISYADKTILKKTMTAACWSMNAKSVSIAVPSRQKILSIKLGDPFDADSDLRNNSWAP